MHYIEIHHTTYLQVQTFSNRSTEQSLRLLSLDHLGVIAARLRKDVTAPTSEQENEELVEILAQVMQSKLDRGSPSPTELKRMVKGPILVTWSIGCVSACRMRFLRITSIFRKS